MRRKSLTVVAVGTVFMLIATAAMAAGSPIRRCGSGSGLRTIGLTADQQLICFRSGSPDRAQVIAPVTGLTAPDTALVGIDYRPADGYLYAVGNGAGIYSIDPGTAVATYVNRLSVPLNGTSFGVDFNPAADALRIISDTGQNLRLPFTGPNIGVIATDMPLVYPGATPTPGTGVVGAAYTNNDGDANTATSLFDLDSPLDQVVLQSPANSGQLAATGKLYADTGAQVGFDIYSRVRGGTTTSMTGLAALSVGGTSSLYDVNLLTGRASRTGNFGYQVIGIAILLNQ